MPSAPRTDPPVVIAPAPPTRCRSAWGSSSRCTASAVAASPRSGSSSARMPSSASAMNAGILRRARLGQARVPLPGLVALAPATRSSGPSAARVSAAIGCIRVGMRAQPLQVARVASPVTRPDARAAANGRWPTPRSARPARRSRWPPRSARGPRRSGPGPARAPPGRAAGAAGPAGGAVRRRPARRPSSSASASATRPGLQQRVEAPQPAPQHVLRVAGALAEREQPAAEHEPLGVAVGAGPGELPRPQRDRQRRRVVEPFGHRQRRRARVADGPRVRQRTARCARAGRAARPCSGLSPSPRPAQRLVAPAAHRVEPRPRR